MTQDELMLQLGEIAEDFCPATPGQGIEHGEFCNCSICWLQASLLIAEVNNGAMIDIDPQQAITIAVPALVETIPALRAEVEALRLENDRLKIERDKARGDLKWTAYELDQCRALAGVLTRQGAAALNEGETA